MGNLSITGTLVSSAALADYVSRVRDLVDDVCNAPNISFTHPVGGHLTAGVLNVRVSAVTEFGETLACPRVSDSVAENDKAVVMVTRVPQATSYRIYASTGSNAETFQTEVTLTQAATLSVTLESIVVGTPLPSSNTATSLVPYRSYEDAVEAAIYRYSTIIPYETYYDETLTNSKYTYELPDGCLNVSKIQYPLSEYPPAYLEDNEFFIKDGEWCFEYWNPTTGEKARIYYTTIHTTATVPTRHFEAVCNIAAAVVCEQLASRYTRLSRRNIGADSVDYRMRSSDSRKDAEVFMETAFKAMSITDLEPSSAAVSLDWYGRH